MKPKLIFKMVKGIIFDWIGTLAKNREELFPYSKKVVEELSTSYRLSLISIAGKGIDNRRNEIERSGLVRYFDLVIVDLLKTPQQYKECMKAMSTIPNDTVIVDDRMFRGIKIGNILGCQTYWIKNGKYGDELPNKETGQPTKIINSIEDLLEVLK